MKVYAQQPYKVDFNKIKTDAEAVALAKKEGIAFEDAYILLADSKLYAGLQNMETLYWSESPEYLLEEFYRNR